MDGHRQAAYRQRRHRRYWRRVMAARRRCSAGRNRQSICDLTRLKHRLACDALLRKMPRRPLCLPDELPTVPLRSRPVPVADAGESRSPDPFVTARGPVSGVPSPTWERPGTAGSE